MHKQTAQAIAYAQNALAFLFLDGGIKDYVQQIYLHGSAVRGSLTKDSDIDLFIDCVHGKEHYAENVAKDAFRRFYQSKDYEKWERFHYTYPLSVQAGILEQWELKTSIAAEGILLYSKNTGIPNAERHILVIMALPKEKKKYLHLIRTLYGRKEKGYKDGGILGKVSGKKISTNVVIIPHEKKDEIIAFLNKEKINYSFKEIAVF